MLDMLWLITRAFWVNLERLIVALMVAIIVLVFANVVLRYGFSSGLRASVELSRVMLVWIVMLGAVLVLKRDQHLAVTEISEGLFPGAVPYLQKICWVIIGVAASLLFWGAYKQTAANIGNISQLTGLPKGLLYLPGVISGVLMLFVCVYRLVTPHERGRDA